MLHLQIAEEAEQDVLDIQVRNPYVATRLAVLFEQLRGDQQLLSRLLENHYGESGDKLFSIRKWETQWHANRDLWRLRDFTLESLNASYRVIYGYFISTRCIYILAVAPRSFDYDATSTIGKRIIATYDRLLDEQ